jgi:hypothetical protein
VIRHLVLLLFSLQERIFFNFLTIVTHNSYTFYPAGGLGRSRFGLLSAGLFAHGMLFPSG